MENPEKEFEEYLQDEKGYRDKTIREYMYYYKKFKNLDITKDNIYWFLVKKNQNNVARSFVKSYLQFLNTHFQKRYDIENLLPERRKKKERKIPEYLSKEETRALLKNMGSQRDKIMLVLSYFAGLRVSELLNLKPTDFNWAEWGETKDENGNLGKGKIFIRNEGGKGGKERMVFLPPHVMHNVYNYIKQYIEPNGHEYLFPGVNGHLGARTWQRKLQHLGRKVLQKNVHPHMLRHTFAYVFMNSSGKIETLRRLMGHQNMDTTQIYAKISDKAMEEDYDEFLKA